MEYQKIKKRLEDTANQSFNFRTRNLVEVSDESKGRYDKSNIRFEKSIISSNLCDYSNACILAKGAVAVPNMAAEDLAVNNINKKVIFKSYPPFTDCITEINNTPVDNAQKINAVMCMYNLIQYSDACFKTLEILWQFYRHKPALKSNGEIVDFPKNNNNSNSFKLKQKITGQIRTGNRKDFEILV